jgi:hypothetical protein
MPDSWCLPVAALLMVKDNPPSPVATALCAGRRSQFLLSITRFVRCSNTPLIASYGCCSPWHLAHHQSSTPTSGCMASTTSPTNRAHACLPPYPLVVADAGTARGRAATRRPARRSVSTSEVFNGFCATCLRERLKELEASATRGLGTGRKSTSPTPTLRHCQATGEEAGPSVAGEKKSRSREGGDSGRQGDNGRAAGGGARRRPGWRMRSDR